MILTLRYRNAEAAIERLDRAFSFRAHLVAPGEGGRIEHAQLKFGTA